MDKTQQEQPVKSWQLSEAAQMLQAICQNYQNDEAKRAAKVLLGIILADIALAPVKTDKETT